ncbi:hypothetical protein [Lelliottia wanjuensis]|uniref:Uncharacterized protein n=1 Tax=Lelliottia wanjuensis TaxID=3050585 RepID=A0AAP4FZ51_9ENTR|nr:MULTISPECIES: hypothetical protein [unclassified Lelliottia]MDK9366439.1 hypothetical protein [Lelliottia sp. V106_12]MDK9618692.1 hypothetical protein [Lelliottia sp. V106_9]
MTTQVYDNNMRGALYKNNQKTEAKHPGARGRAKIEGVWFWISAWTQFQRNSGERYQSLSFTKLTDEEVQKYEPNDAPKAAQQAAPASSQQQPQNEPPMDFNDDIPFAPIGLQEGNNYLHCI